MNTLAIVGIGVVVVIVIVIIVLWATGKFSSVSEDGQPTEKKTETLQRARLVDPRTAAERRRDYVYAY